MRFKKELKKEFLNGRTISYIAKEIRITNGRLTNILNGKVSCLGTTAKLISNYGIAITYNGNSNASYGVNVDRRYRI